MLMDKGEKLIENHDFMLDILVELITSKIFNHLSYSRVIIIIMIIMKIHIFCIKLIHMVYN